MKGIELYYYLNLGFSWLLTGTLLAIELYALALAFGASDRAFSIADKRPKIFWVSILGIAALLGVTTLPIAALSWFNSDFIRFLFVLPAVIFLASVRPNMPTARRR